VEKKLGIFLRCFSLELATDYLTVAMNWGQFSEIFRKNILRILKRILNFDFNTRF
jgi:hypothetical protein